MQIFIKTNRFETGFSPGTETCRSILMDHVFSENFVLPLFSVFLELYNTTMPALEKEYSKNVF